MDSVKILLFSDDEKLYNSTERIIGKKHQLKWCTYQQLENNRYPTADVVIFHFTKEIIERERAFAAIIKIKVHSAFFYLLVDYTLYYNYKSFPW